jgi:hypothetical protein
MRPWTKSGCVVLAWSILPLVLMAAGMKGSVYPAQANTRTDSNTEVTLTLTLSVAVAPVTAASHPSRYAVQRGDTLSAIAARFAVRGGWPALYAVNRTAIGPDPDIIRPSAVLTMPGPAAPSPAAPRPAGRPIPAPSAPAGTGHRPLPGRTAAPAASGMPQWLKTLLLAVGLVIPAVFLAGSVLTVRRRRQQTAGQAVQLGDVGVGRRRDRGSRSVAAAARVHPAGVAGSPGQNARSLTCSLVQIDSALTMPAAVPPAGPGRGPQASRKPSSRMSGGGLMCAVKQLPSAAAAARSGGADQ